MEFFAWGNASFIMDMYNFTNKVLKSKFNVQKGREVVET